MSDDPTSPTAEETEAARTRLASRLGRFLTDVTEIAKEELAKIRADTKRLDWLENNVEWISENPGEIQRAIDEISAEAGDRVKKWSAREALDALMKRRP